jgi:hypothetical protein
MFTLLLLGVSGDRMGRKHLFPTQKTARSAPVPWTPLLEK